VFQSGHIVVTSGIDNTDLVQKIDVGIGIEWPIGLVLHASSGRLKRLVCGVGSPRWGPLLGGVSGFRDRRDLAV
jgi:hypothetical protein